MTSHMKKSFKIIRNCFVVKKLLSILSYGIVKIYKNVDDFGLKEKRAISIKLWFYFEPPLRGNWKTKHQHTQTNKVITWRLLVVWDSC